MASSIFFRCSKGTKVMRNLLELRKNSMSEVNILTTSPISYPEGSSCESSYFFLSLNEKYLRCKLLINYISQHVPLKDTLQSVRRDGRTSRRIDRDWIHHRPHLPAQQRRPIRPISWGYGEGLYSECLHHWEYVLSAWREWKRGCLWVGEGLP